MKILFVIENYIPHIGGVEIVFKNLAEGLAKQGHDVSIVTHRIKSTSKYETINGVDIYRVNCLNSRYFFTFFSVPLVIKLAKDCDIIHTTTYNGAFPAKVAAMFRRKPSIITVHEVLGKLWAITDVSWLTAKILKFFEWLIIKLNFDKYVCVSNSTKKQVLTQSIKKDKVMTIYNGVDYDFWNPNKYDGEIIRNKLGLQDNFVFLFYGRPGVSKGLEYLIKAIPKIIEKVPNAMFFGIVSKDKAYQKRYDMILDMIKNLGIENNVIMHDPVPYKELPNFIKMADCVVIPSLTEGFGFTTAESCAMDKPVVVSNTTSLPEVVSGRYKLVSPKDSSAIAEAVINIANNKYEQKPKKIFNLQDNIDNYVKLYKSMLNKEKI